MSNEDLLMYLENKATAMQAKRARNCTMMPLPGLTIHLLLVDLFQISAEKWYAVHYAWYEPKDQVRSAYCFLGVRPFPNMQPNKTVACMQRAYNLSCIHL
jgi:hypothetical protein